MRGHQAAVVRHGKAVIDQQHYAFVLRGADHTPGGLQHLVHAGAAVGVVKAGTACLLKIVPQLLLPGSNLRQPWAHDAYTNQPVAGQVNALPKYAAHHGKAKQGLAGARHKLGQKGRFLLFIHRVFLLDAVDFRAVFLELCISLLHIRIAGEKRQIIPAARPHHRRQAFLHNGKACIPVLIPGADIADAEQSLIARGEGAAQGNGPCFGHVSCDAIIMSAAKVRAIPEISCNHVDASLIHEAAIGRIAGEQLLKLETLGLTPEEAEEKILEGFLR